MKQLKIKDEVHARLVDFTNKNESFSESINRLLDMAEAPKTIAPSTESKAIVKETPKPISKPSTVIGEFKPTPSLEDPDENSLTASQIDIIVGYIEGKNMEDVNVEIDRMSYSGTDKRKILA